MGRAVSTPRVGLGAVRTGVVTGAMALAASAMAQPVAGCEAASEGDAASSLVQSVRALPDGYTLPPCASPLMAKVHEAVGTTLRRATVPLPLLHTSANRAAPAPLLEGPAIFGRWAELIEGAEREIAMQVYVWEEGSESTRAITAAVQRLEERLRAEDAGPVHVRLLVDASEIGFGSKPASQQLPALEREFARLGLDPSFVSVEIAAYTHTILGNVHEKSIVVDGRHAVVTGANPQGHHDSGEPWFDAGFEFEGDIALALREEIADGWRRAKRWGCGTRRVSRDGANRCLGPVRRMEPLDVARIAAAPQECRPMILAGRPANANPFRNRVDDPQGQAFLAAFGAAEERIRIQTPNLNDDHARRAILDAVARGVDVEIVLSKGFNDLTENMPGQGGTNEEVVRDLFRKLRERGVADACERLKVRWYSHDGVTAIDGNGPRASHAKYASVDGQLAIVGSANMDTQAWNHSREVNVVVDDAETTAAWDAALFEASFERGIPVSECPAAQR